MAKFQFPKQYAVLTAENPNGKALSPAENLQRNQALEADLKARGHVYHHGLGVYQDPESGQMLQEHSFVVEGIDPEEAKSLGRKYGQNGVLTHEGYHNLNSDTKHPIQGMHKTAVAPYTKVHGQKYDAGVDWSKEKPDTGGGWETEPRDARGRWTT